MKLSAAVIAIFLPAIIAAQSTAGQLAKIYDAPLFKGQFPAEVTVKVERPEASHGKFRTVTIYDSNDMKNQLGMRVVTDEYPDPFEPSAALLDAALDSYTKNNFSSVEFCNPKVDRRMGRLNGRYQACNGVNKGGHAVYVSTVVALEANRLYAAFLISPGPPANPTDPTAYFNTIEIK